MIRAQAFISSLQLRWFVKSARLPPGQIMVSKLSNDIIDAENDTGTGFRKREDRYK